MQKFQGVEVIGRRYIDDYGKTYYTTKLYVLTTRDWYIYDSNEYDFSHEHDYKYVAYRILERAGYDILDYDHFLRHPEVAFTVVNVTKEEALSSPAEPVPYSGQSDCAFTITYTPPVAVGQN